MAVANVQPPKMKQLNRGDRLKFAASDDSAMMKQIQATHSPDGRNVEVKPILLIIEDIFRRASHGFDGVFSGTQEHADALEDKASVVDFEAILDGLAYIFHKISCELSCKCSGGADAHSTTVAIFSMLSNYSWDAKVVLSLAAFAVMYGEFWLVARLAAKEQLAKSVAILKQLPDIIDHDGTLKSKFDSINNLIKAMLDVSKCIMEFKELPAQYISPDTPPMSTAMAHVPTAAYWTIRSMVASASQIISLLGLSYEYISSTTETWELSSLAHKVSNIHVHLKEQLRNCYLQIDEMKRVETYQMLIRLFEMVHLDNMRVLKALIYSKDDILPLLDGSNKTRVSIEILRRKTVLLLISDLDISPDEITILEQLHTEMRSRPTELPYELVWLPIVNRMEGNQVTQKKFEELQGLMPWYSLYLPTLLDPAVVKFIKDMWHFNKKLIIVALDPQGKVVCPNAFHMMWIWANNAYPFTSSKEESLWKAENWRLELIVDTIDPTIFDWVNRGSYVCLYGGEDLAWIRTFTAKAKEVAHSLAISLEMVYVGKSNAKERVRKICSTIMAEGLSHCWSVPLQVWYFWTRLESMLFTKMQHGKTIENDGLMQEVLTVLSFDGSEHGWAIFCREPGEMARAKGDMLLKGFQEFESWAENARQIGFIRALNEKLTELYSPHHCNRLILPGNNGDIPEKVVCAECGRPMEKYFMYRCCDD